MPKRRKKHFSYGTGERGRNRVRSFRHSANGELYLEFREKGKRHSVRLDICEEEEAKQQAITDIDKALRTQTLKHRVTHVVGLDETAKAHSLIETGGFRGCVVVRP